MSLLQKVEGQVQDSVAAVGGRRVRTTDGLYQEYVKNPHAQFNLSAVSLCVLVEERLLKQRIAELSRYRRNGITKLEGAGVHRESERVKTCCYFTQTAVSLIY